jgi:hypothetical protein
MNLNIYMTDRVGPVWWRASHLWSSEGYLFPIMVDVRECSLLGLLNKVNKIGVHRGVVHKVIKGISLTIIKHT